MGNSIELEVVTNSVDCIIDPNNYDESDTGINAGLRNRFTVAVGGDIGKATNISIDWEISNPRLVRVICTLDNNLNNEYVKHFSYDVCNLYLNLKLLKVQLTSVFL